jgi:hypothetical protein
LVLLEPTRGRTGVSEGQSSGQSGGGQSDLRQDVEELKRDQAVQAATQAGAQATQAATQAGAQATQAAAQAGMAAAIVSGFVCLIVGTLLGIAIANNHRHGH